MAVKYEKIIKYLVTAVCAQPLHIGSALGDKEEVLIHPADDMPFIQASGISGVFRQYLVNLRGNASAESLFGSKRFESDDCSADGASRVRFSDGKFCKKNLVLELRPRVSINPESGTCDASRIKGTEKLAGHKFNMEYIGAGAEFEFSIYLYDEGRQDEMEELLSAMHQGKIQFGGQKSNGCGFMELKDLRKIVFDMRNADARKKWAEEETLPKEAYSKISSEIQNRGVKSAAAYEVTVSGNTEGELLVKSIAVQDYGKDAPDSTNIRNAKKEYIVPGSSLKGAIRNQMERIASYLDVTSVIRDTFGYTEKKEDKDGGKAGNIVFYDTVVGNIEDNDKAKVKNRIHIDKFTGGVIHGGLFNEKNVSGDLVFHIVIQDKNNPDRTCGLLLMALRDLAVKMMSVGGGYSVGKGMIDVREIKVYDRRNGTEAVFDFENQSVRDDNAIAAKCMKALQAKEGAV